jgi:hypothetical protein
MGGGLIDIVSYGFNDLYLTGSPQITYFKIVYRRHTNFSRESINVPVGQINFGDEITVNLPKVGDLISNTFLQFEIPEVYLLKTDTASDLSVSETNVLTTPIQISMSSDEINIIDDYQTILDFIVVNTAGYRVAVDKQYIKNQNVSEYVSSILSVLTFKANEDVKYDGALTRASVFEKSIGSSFYNILNSKFSDIRKILTTIPSDLITHSLISVAEVLQLVTNAINVLVEIKGYYFKKVQRKHILDKDANSLYAKFAWVNNLGYSMIDRVDINIGGERIDRHYGDWMNIWYQLTSRVEQDSQYNKLIGNVRELTSFDRNKKKSYIITVPLNFWFCRKMGLAFPLISLQYSPVSITIKLKQFDNCAYIEKLPDVDSDGNSISINAMSLEDIWDNQGYVINSNLLVEYIYLDSLERKRFAQSSHEYLIETLERMTIENISEAEQLIDLDFTGPSKEIVWHAKKTIYNTGTTSTMRNYPTEYGMDIVDKYNPTPFNRRKMANPFISSQLLLNGKERFKYAGKKYFNVLQPYSHHTRTPSEGINVYSFCFYPEEHQPSGTCNFTVISNPTLLLTVNNGMFSYFRSDVQPEIEFGSDKDEVLQTDVNLTFYSHKYNVIRFIGGFGAPAYTYSVSK